VSGDEIQSDRKASQLAGLRRLLLEAAIKAEPQLGHDAVSGIFLGVTWAYITKRIPPAQAIFCLREWLRKIEAGTDASTAPAGLERAKQ
jgi:hypothetical protein